MAGSEHAATPATTPGPVPPITPAPGEDGAYEDESVKRGCPLDSARIRDWYQNSGHNHTETDLKNAEGLMLKGHHWEVPNPRGKVVLVHGYGVHSRFEYLRHDHMNPSTPPMYEGSWIHQLNQVQMSVHCLDHQSFGGSQGHKGKRGHVLELEHLPRDLIQFLHEQVLPSQDSNLPIFVCGISMGGCVTARAIEILGGGPTTSIKKPGRPEEANSNEHADVSGTSTEGSKQALPIRGAACLAPMFRLDRLKKKHKIFLPSIKALSSLFPALEIGKPAKNQLYPFFEDMLHADPLCYTGKSRARMSHEMLRAVATVQEQAKYLTFPDAAVKTSQSPLPLPVYVPETPALLIVHSQNDTFVDPEGSIIVGATVHAKLHGNSEVIEKYQGLYDQISSGETSVDHPDANLWLLDKMWHCLSKEHPDSDILIDRLINEWILPHLGGDEGEKKTEQKENEKKKKGGKDAKKEETAPSTTGEQEKDEKQKKKDKKKENTTPEESSVPPPAAPAAPAEDVSPPTGESGQPSSSEEAKKEEEPAPPVSSQPMEETQAEGGQGPSSSLTPPPATPAEEDKPVPTNEAPVEETPTTEKEKEVEEERKSPEPSPPPSPQESNSQEEVSKSEDVKQESEEGKDEPAKESTSPPPAAVQEEPAKTPEVPSAGETPAPAEEKQQEEPSVVNEQNTEKAPSPPLPESNEEAAGPKDEESPAAEAAAAVTGGDKNEEESDL
ncbi:phospholipase [Cystoisospora suis]|uniref:Phospholipase n=1 Tax=Cystoisospora suis TaxID=483139 RepID=A0A2C6KPP7_9APIC|nr:phospholipase [Cystoisospora suis]